MLMEWYEILTIVVIALSLIVVGFSLLKKRRYNKIIERVVNKFQSAFEVEEFHAYPALNVYQLEFKTDKKFLVKIIDMSPGHEIVITNADHVVINQDIAHWHRTTKPHFVAGIKDFLKLKSEIEELVKIVLIYPGCYNITKYTNEHDCYLVPKYQIVDGLYFIQYRDLAGFLAKQ